jgi:hypothetical protein
MHKIYTFLRKYTELRVQSIYHMQQLLRTTSPPPPPLCISLQLDLNSLCCSLNVHPTLKCPETEACAQSYKLNRKKYCT